jgi:hypothetical protein
MRLIAIRSFGRISSLPRMPFAWVFMLTVFCPAQLQSQPVDDSDRMTAMLEQLRLSLDRIQSIEYKAAHLYDKTSGGGTSRHYEYEYAFDGDLFYCSYGEAGSTWKKRTAYNGKKYQGIEKPQILEYKKTPVEKHVSFSGLVQPLIVPFLYFAFKEPPFEFNVLLRKSTWDRIKSLASLKGQEKYKDSNCEVLEMKVGPQRLMVYLDKTFDYYPIKIMTENKEISSTQQVETTVVKIVTPRGDVFVPIKINAEARAKNEVFLTQTYTIDPESIKVNTPIDPRTFELDEKHAVGVYNWDRPGFDKLSPPKESANATTRWYIPLTLLLVITCYILYRRKYRKTAF